MMFYLVLLLTVVFVLAISIFAVAKKSKKLASKNAGEAEKYCSAIKLFYEEFGGLKNIYIKHYVAEKFCKKWQDLRDEVGSKKNSKRHSCFYDISKFMADYDMLPQTISAINENFILQKSREHDIFFSNIDGKSLDEQQRAAVICEDERVLVLAGAGSGKTLTIAAKVKYLCEVQKVLPQDILLISYTKKSAEEMTKRIRKMGIEIEASTFHKLGMEIVKHAQGFRPDVCDNLPGFINNFFENDLLQHPDVINPLMKYFTYYLEIPPDMNTLKSLGELYEAEKSMDLETLKSKYDKQRYIDTNAYQKSVLHTTIKGEHVKSIEETKIANFLFMHGVNYEYEKLYPHQTQENMRKSYRPDFYLPDYDIYLEHFGVSKDFKVPWLSSIEEAKYLEGIEWKRKLHKQFGTTLLETYSYYSSEGVLLEKLESLLQQNGIVFCERDFIDIYDAIYAKKSNKYFAPFMSLCSTFITLFKSAGYKIEKFAEMKQSLYGERNKFIAKRNMLFLDIIKIIFEEYQNYLSLRNEVDFSDMINLATEQIAGGFEFHRYKHIIVDEYQDISLSRFMLIKAIATQTNASVFCVGDDWQSIYRFAGSDISLFTDFAKHFGWAKILRIEKTYRNSQELINEASNFVLKNPIQLHKNLKSEKSLVAPLVFCGYDSEPYLVVEKVVAKIISDSGADKNIMLLGRMNRDIDILKKSTKFYISAINSEIKVKYLPSPKTPITFLSVHKSKGLEADNVLVLNFKNYKLGFPNQIEDDIVLNFVLTKAEAYNFAEERRLFYVAITRTKNKTFVITDNKMPSVFFREFKHSPHVSFIDINSSTSKNNCSCPFCKTGTIVKIKTKTGRYFAACTNYPLCRYTYSNTQILVNPKRCPKCGGFMTKKISNKNGGTFIGCTNYPLCKHTEAM